MEIMMDTRMVGKEQQRTGYRQEPIEASIVLVFVEL
jgi:hypothetical protein